MSTITLLIDFPDADVHLWNGAYDLEYGGVVYMAAHGVIDIAPSSFAGAGDETSLSVTVPIADNNLKSTLLRVFRQAFVSLTWIVQDEQTGQWRETGLRFAGKLASPRIVKNEYHVELHTYSQEQWVENLVTWSDENHTRRHPTDRGMEFLAAIQQEYEVLWPPQYAS